VKNNIVAISIFSLGICIVFGCWLLSNSLRDNKSSQPIKNPPHQLLTQSEVAKYLGISVRKIQELTEYPDGSGYTSILPHVKVDNTNYYPKKALDKWLQNVELTTVP
jgi:hypothetical protein